MTIELNTAFLHWLRTRRPDWTTAEIADITAPDSGTSAETVLFSVVARRGAAPERLVLRCGPRGRGIFPVYDLSVQCGVLRALDGVLTTAPRVRHYEPDAAILGTPFLIFDYIEGATPSDSPPGLHGHGMFFDANQTECHDLWRAGIEAIAALHAVDWRALNLPELSGTATDSKGAMAGQATLLRSWMRWGGIEEVELLQQGLRWLDTTPPPTDNLSLVWGDARPGNVRYRDGLAVGLLDWEIASIGLPEFDLFYWWWSAEVLAEVNRIDRLATLPDKQTTIAMYEQAAGRPIGDVAPYAETFTVLRLAIMAALGVRAAVGDGYTEDYLTDNGPARALRAALG